MNMMLSIARLCLISLPAILLAACAWASASHGSGPVTYRYTPPDWPKALDADLYLPADVSQPPVVLVIHGGGWTSGSRDEGYVRLICRHLASHGFAALSVDYRLAPEARFPAQFDDLAEALRWLAVRGPGLGLDTRHVGVWGYSAGAHLASLISTREQALPLAAVVAGGTPADLRVWPDSPYVNALLGQSLADAPARWAEASPVVQVNAATPAHFLYHGRLDTLVEYDQMQRLASALQAVHVPVLTSTRWLYGHILTAVLPGSSFDEATDFLQAQLRSGRMAARTVTGGEQ